MENFYNEYATDGSQIVGSDNFITEYNEEEPFIADKHLINYLRDRTKTLFPNLKCDEISNLEDIINE